ncbi:MAG: hypothetical protein QOF44_5722 [Streptomyces sp.]|nr:hypothetical protein [Streptomyces sp.]
MTARMMGERIRALTARSRPLLAAIALLTAGCTSGGNDAGASHAASATPSATGVADGAQAGPSASASPSPPYPTNAKGCHPTGNWTQKEAAAWVQLQDTVFHKAVDGIKDKVQFSKSLKGYDGPLCEPVTVQVQFWTITYGSATGAETTSATGSPPDYYFSMRSLKRTELRIDGREDHDVYMPKSFYAGDRSPCVGTLLAVYVGKPLTSKELPTDIDFGDSYLATNSATFPTKRVADSELSPPSAPNVCDPNGKPTADPSATPAPGASTYPSFPYKPYEPTPSFSLKLNPTHG